MKKWLVIERLVLTLVVEAETKQDAIDSWDQSKANSKGSISAKRIKNKGGF